MATAEVMDVEVQGDGLEITTAQFDIAIHNVVVTVQGKASGDHRTFSIETVLKTVDWNAKVNKKRAKKGQPPLKPYIVQAGTRVAYLLSGPNRESEDDWKRFGFVGHTGIITVFPFLKGTPQEPSMWERYARMLAAPQKYLKNYDFKLMAFCRRCNRPLTHPESIDTGLGPICGGRE